MLQPMLGRWSSLGFLPASTAATAAEITLENDLVRLAYGRYELKLGTESHHRPSDTTTLHQRLTVYPALDGSGNYRAVFESALSVSITTRLAMTTTLTINRNSDPGDDVKKNDILFVTGLTFKID